MKKILFIGICLVLIILGLIFQKMDSGHKKYSAPTNSERAWIGWYHSEYNVRYAEINNSEGHLEEWKKIRQEWASIYNSKDIESPETLNTIDKLNDKVYLLEKRETNLPNHDLGRKIQSKMNQEYDDGKLLPRKE